MIMPFGTYMSPNRLMGFAAVFAMAESAGIMLSSSGSATAAPNPRSTVRREICFFVMNMAISFLRYLSVALADWRAAPSDAVLIVNGTLLMTPMMIDDHR